MTSSTHQTIRSHNSIPIDSLHVPWLLIGGRASLWPHNVAKLLISHVKMLKMACWSNHWRPCLYHRSCHEKHQRMGFLAMPWEHYNILQPVEFHVPRPLLLSTSLQLCWQRSVKFEETSCCWEKLQVEVPPNLTHRLAEPASKGWTLQGPASISECCWASVGFHSTNPTNSRYGWRLHRRCLMRTYVLVTGCQNGWMNVDFELLSLYMCPYICCDQLVFDCCHPTRFLKYQWLPVT